MRAVFRVDSSLTMGLGHVMRCLTLANELERRNYKVVFICRELVGNITLSIKYPVLILPKDDNFKSDNFF